MKKQMILFLVLMMSLSFTACGAEKGREKEAVSGKNNLESEMEYEEIFGTITNQVGNEIELAIVKMPDVEEPVEEEEDTEDIPAEMDAVSTLPAMEGGASAVEEGQNMEYTGENLSVTLPAGVKIYYLGEETNMEALSKGSLIYLVVDNQEDLNIHSVYILEK